VNKITTTAAARILGVTPSRVRQFVLQGRLPAEKIGRDLFLDREAVEEFAIKPRRPGPEPGRRTANEKNL